MKSLAEIIHRIGDWLFSPSVKFKIHDSVQCVSGGALMVVLRIVKPTKQIPTRVLCQWYDRDKQENRTDFFFLHELKPFDWFNVG